MLHNREEVMKKTFALCLVLLVLFLTCKKDSNNPVSTPPPSSNGTLEPTPIGIPIGPPTITTIGPSGGTVTSADGTLSISIPAGALSGDTAISVQPITNYGPGGLGTAYRLGPSGMRFSVPVTLQFTYSSDSVQVPELLGVAYQDTDNIWYSMPEYTVDTVSHTVTAPITHFSDWIDFERVRIIPRDATLWVNQTLRLNLLEYVPEGSENQPQPIYRVADNDVAWAASAGTVSRTPDPISTFLYATYRAPASIPTPNPVRVSATVNRRFTYHGTIVPTNRTVFFSYVTITDSSAVFHVDLYYHNRQYMVATLPFTLDDTCSMDVTINRAVVTVTNIENHNSGVTPASAMAGQCTLTWVPGGVGPMNITYASASIDTMNNVNLLFYHTAFEEEFTYSCPGEPPITLGNNPTNGNPGNMQFPSNPGINRFYWIVNNEVNAWITKR